MTNDQTHGSDGERPHTDGTQSGVPDPDGLEGQEGSAARPDGRRAREPREGSTEDHLETRVPLEPGTAPRSPRGDALLDGTGTRHGVDARHERPEDG